jgi:hypothetical protein
VEQAGRQLRAQLTMQPFQAACWRICVACGCSKKPGPPALESLVAKADSLSAPKLPLQSSISGMLEFINVLA